MACPSLAFPKHSERVEEAVRFDELGLKTDAAIAKLRKMAKIQGCSGSKEIGAFLNARANEFYERGREKGVVTALLVSALDQRIAECDDADRSRIKLRTYHLLVSRHQAG